MTKFSSIQMEIGKKLQENKRNQVFEIILLFLIPIVFISLTTPFAGENPLVVQGIVWLANVMMLFYVWFSLKVRGKTWSHLGLSSTLINLRSFLLSFPVLIGAVAGFIIGSIIMANIVGIPESADMSGYNYIQGNFPMLLLALFGVFIVSSFGEEVIYRGFLISRLSELGGGGKSALYFAVITSSVIFGLIHYAWGPMGMVQTGFMGLALGVSYLLVKKNLWILIFAHGYMDALLMIQMYLG